MWYALCLLLAGILFWKTLTIGPRYALGFTVLVSLLMPFWTVLRVGGFEIDLHTAACIMGLLVYSLHPRTRLRTRLVLADWALLCLGIVHVATDWLHDGFSLVTPLQAYGEWGMPYLAGRLAIQSMDDVKPLTGLVCGICVVFFLWAAIEVLAQNNPANVVVGERSDNLMRKDAMRWGIKRAEGPTEHPIFFGAIQVMLMPWALYAISRFRAKDGPGWWLLAFPAAFVGTFLTASRGPLLALFVGAGVVAYCFYPRIRGVLLGLLTFAIALLVFADKDALLNKVHDITSEDKPRVQQTGAAGTLNRTLTSTSFRWHLFKIYSPLMWRAGVLGYGTSDTRGFPLPVALRELPPEQRVFLDKIKPVDNAYILLVLRFGWLGLACFVTLCVAAACYFFVPACRSSANKRWNRRWFWAGMAGALIGIEAMMVTVFFAQHFGFFFIWTCGVAAGLRLDGFQEPQPSHRREQGQALEAQPV